MSKCLRPEPYKLEEATLVTGILSSMATQSVVKDVKLRTEESEGSIITKDAGQGLSQQSRKMTLTDMSKS